MFKLKKKFEKFQVHKQFSLAAWILEKTTACTLPVQHFIL